MQEVIKNMIDQIGLYRQVVPNKFKNKLFFKLKKKKKKIGFGWMDSLIHKI